MSGAGQSGCGREGGDGVRGGGAVGNGSQGGNGGVAGGSGHRMCRLLCVSNTELPALGASCQRMAAALAAAPIPATAPTLQRKRCGSLAPEAWPSGPPTPTQLRLPHTSLRSSWETKAVRNTGSAPSCSWMTSSASNALTAERRKMASSSSPSSTGASPSSTGGAVRNVARGTGAWSSSVQLRIVTPSARAGRQTTDRQTKCGWGVKHETNLLRVRIFLNTPATLDQLSKANNASPHATARHRTVHNAWHRAFGLSLLHPERGSHTSHYFTLHLTPHGSGAPAPCNGRAPPRAAPPPWPRRRPRRRRARRRIGHA